MGSLLIWEVSQIFFIKNNPAHLAEVPQGDSTKSIHFIRNSSPLLYHAVIFLKKQSHKRGTAFKEKVLRAGEMEVGRSLKEIVSRDGGQLLKRQSHEMGEKETV